MFLLQIVTKSPCRKALNTENALFLMLRLRRLIDLGPGVCRPVFYPAAGVVPPRPSTALLHLARHFLPQPSRESIYMAPRYCPRFLSLSAATFILVSAGGQAFFLTAAPTATCSRIGTQQRGWSASASEVGRPPTSPIVMVSPLVLSSEQVDAPGQWSPVRDPGSGGAGGGGKGEEEEDFDINLGRALDYLATDVPLMFSAAPRLEIFTSEVRLKVCELPRS